ncbi:hypothetical protein A2483_00015 [Candidatus Peregrinibacteria bacterium RIFOXYC2_FULL_33_13]|nr:MAG: Bacterioferritin comigratory protein [Candidatus Peregrinibacteria bacterium GW2011_GWA2_33_10]KKP40881.1 MAG: peroxiredoxin, peroxiredoxin Q/BCP [Candidatus Peregrinibacteria bacterium GW2011_GWC2_33_13]OGJ50768.1 MAG: hypothetical protein A2229_05440 [Candidatus Peregrinibacteria bacterium RIFOXYA2_FULL_33_7]OGJ53177.1 MAG: hypothetical protein A2483_00015 [Candidatus Peregrinibacteria bacterium RIFOXYC2_FULL_33_13]
METLEGKKAPPFKLPDEQGNIHTLEQHKGQKILLYFYPKDMTPGCSLEAQNFRDNLELLKRKGVEILGVSTDSQESHQKFKEKYRLNFPLLSDVDKEVVKKYGVWKEKSIFGRTIMSTRRDSFLIDEDGIIEKHFKKVDPRKHAKEVLELVRG